VVGRVVSLNKYPYTILGVAPSAFHGTLLFASADLFVPIVNQEQIQGVNRLARPGLYGDYVGPVVQRFLLGVMLLAGLILLAACVNLGSVFAARTADRSREVALRASWGASRARVLGPLFTEALLLALLGGAAGLAGGVVVLRGLTVWQPFSRFPIHVAVMPDITVYKVAMLVTLASGLLFGAVPVRRTLRTDPYEIVKAGPAGGIGRRIGVRDVLLVQIAICALLVTASAVAVRGLVRSRHSHFGFEPNKALLIDADLSMPDIGMPSRPRCRNGWSMRSRPFRTRTRLR